MARNLLYGGKIVYKKLKKRLILLLLKPALEGIIKTCLTKKI